LIVLPTWVGDFVMATPTLRALRQRFSTAEITLLAVKNLIPLIEGGPWMERILTWPGTAGTKAGLVQLLAFSRQLRPASFDLAVLLSNSFRSALLTALARCRRRVGYRRQGRGWLLTDPMDVPRTNGRIVPHPICHYYSRIAETLGCPPPGDRLELFTTDECDKNVAERLQHTQDQHHGPLIVVTPGASFGVSKLWLPDRFAEVADRLIATHDARIIISFGPGEKPIAESIASHMKNRPTLFDDPPLTLGQLKSLIRRCDLLIGTDAGPRHIAKAFGVPVVTLFGPTHQAWTDTNYPAERKIAVDIDCGPCQKKICPLKHHECMTRITTNDVFDAATSLLSGAHDQPAAPATSR